MRIPRSAWLVRALCLLVAPCLLPAVLGSCSNAAAQPDLSGFERELPEGELGLVKLGPGDPIPDFSTGWYQRGELSESVANSLSYLAAPSSRAFYPYGPITHERMMESLDRFQQLLHESGSAESFRQSLVDEFEVWIARGASNTGDVLYTGYCQPILDGSLRREGRYQHPLYRLPEDLVKGEDGAILGRRTASGDLVPYYTSGELMQNGHLEGKELVWLADPFDAYIAQVQGSAIIRLPDDRLYEVGYAGKNGHEYKSIGLTLIEEGRISKRELSLTTLQNYFRDHPAELDRLLPTNPSFVFFRESQGGPFGALGRKVLPMRSLATDKEVFPRAGLAFVEARLPFMDANGRLVQRPTRFFALDQDRGGAIRSAGRCDVFLGTGDEAVERAGHVLAMGRMYYLVLRDETTIG